MLSEKRSFPKCFDAKTYDFEIYRWVFLEKITYFQVIFAMLLYPVFVSPKLSLRKRKPQKWTFHDEYILPDIKFFILLQIFRKLQHFDFCAKKKCFSADPAGVRVLALKIPGIRLGPGLFFSYFKCEFSHFRF